MLREMLGQSFVPNGKMSLPLRVETDEAASSQDHTSQRRTRFLWTGLGFAVIAVIGVSAHALHPLASHAYAEPSRHAPLVAFSPMPALGLRGIHSARHAAVSDTALRPAIHPVAPPGLYPGSVPAVKKAIDFNNGVSSELYPTFKVDVKAPSELLRQSDQDVIKVTSDEQWQQLLASSVESESMLVAFLGTDFCRKCAALKPKFEKFSRGYSGKDVMWAQVKATKTAQLRKDFNITVVPTFLIFSKGKLVEELVAGTEKGSTETLFRKIGESLGVGA